MWRKASVEHETGFTVSHRVYKLDRFALELVQGYLSKDFIVSVEMRNDLALSHLVQLLHHLSLSLCREILLSLVLR